jgi:hypothetical protein
LLRPALRIAILVAAILIPVARAHPGGEPLIHVPLDHVVPGQSFPVIGADLGKGAVVTVELKKEDRVDRLGRITAGSDGHFEGTLAVPPTSPDGYAQLVATSSDGSKASTWILVGARTESTPPPPGGTKWGRERALIVLGAGLGVIGAAVALAAMASRRREHGGRAE